jgi:steroid delta-isomerase-like uncharacterized protein
MPSPNKQIVKRFLNDLWSQGNLAVANEIIAANHVQHDPATPNFGKGPDGAKQIVTLYRSAFPDLHFTIDQIVDGEDFVTTRYTARGTHKGELRGIAATNKSAKVEGIFISRISRGKIAETWVVWDALGLMQQLGQVPALEKAKAQVAK